MSEAAVVQPIKPPDRRCEGPAVAINRETILEAVSTLFAVEGVLTELNGNCQSNASDIIEGAGHHVLLEAFGVPPKDDIAYERDEIVVETWCQGLELSATILAHLATDSEFAAWGSLAGIDFQARAAAHREDARRVRKDGTIVRRGKDGTIVRREPAV